MELRTKERQLNGFDILAQTDPDPEKKRIYEFLATCDSKDLNTLIDSGAFNDRIRGFVEYAIQEERRNG